MTSTVGQPCNEVAFLHFLNSKRDTLKPEIQLFPSTHKGEFQFSVMMQQSEIILLIYFVYWPATTNRMGHTTQ